MSDKGRLQGTFEDETLLVAMNPILTPMSIPIRCSSLHARLIIFKTKIILNIGYIVQTILILIAPALSAAFIYMELGRIAELTDAEGYLMVRRRWLTRIFVCGDVASFLMQAGGGGMISFGSAISTLLPRS